MLNNFNSIYLDFDGTITKKDTVGSFISSFADDGHQEIEQEWVSGKINSKDCMQRQLALIKNLTREKFNDFLNTIEIQAGFKEFCSFAQKNNKKITILSDGFDIFIEYVLKRENLDLDFFSNHLEIEENNGILNFKLYFPNTYKHCELDLGMCKCSKIHKNENFLYTGDGLSDRCIARKSKLLFAKNNLKKYCLENSIKFIEFIDFFQILNYIKEGETPKCKA